MLNIIESSFNKKKLISYIILILLFSITSRILILNYTYNNNPYSIEINDTARYEKPALNLLHKGTLAIEPKSIDTHTLSTTPGYSLFIAGIYKLLGENRYPLVVAQILVSSLTILTIFFIAFKLWAQKIALIAMALMSIEPLQVLYSQIIIAETLFTLFITLSILSMTYLLTSDKHHYKWALALGLSLALSTMIKPISYYLVIVIIIGLVFAKSQLGYQWKKLTLILSLILIPSILIDGAWQVRNGLLTGVYEINDAKSETLLYWKAKGVLMQKNSSTETEAQQEILKRLPAHFSSFKEKTLAEQELAIDIITNDPASYLILSANSVKDIVFGIGIDSQTKHYSSSRKGRNIRSKSNLQTLIATKGISKKSSIINIIEEKLGYKLGILFLMAYSAFFLLAVYCFSIYALIHSLSQPSKLKVLSYFMLGIVLYFIAISSGHISAYSRMRVPFMPILLLYTSLGLYLFTNNYLSKRSAIIATCKTRDE